MLPIILEAAIRSMVLTAVIWLGLTALRITNPHILIAAWQLVLLVSLLMPFLVGSVRIPVPSAALPIYPNRLLRPSARQCSIGVHLAHTFISRLPRSCCSD